MAIPHRRRTRHCGAASAPGCRGDTRVRGCRCAGPEDNATISFAGAADSTAPQPDDPVRVLCVPRSAEPHDARLHAHLSGQVRRDLHQHRACVDHDRDGHPGAGGHRLERTDRERGAPPVCPSRSGGYGDRPHSLLSPDQHRQSLCDRHRVGHPDDGCKHADHRFASDLGTPPRKSAVRRNRCPVQRCIRNLRRHGATGLPGTGRQHR